MFKDKLYSSTISIKTHVLAHIIFKTHTLASMNIELTLFPIETPFNTFANRADPDQAALTRAA